MRLLFVESLDFTAAVHDYFETDDKYRAFQAFLMESRGRRPDEGLRGPAQSALEPSGAGKGEAKRAQDEMDDLDSDQRRELAKLAAAYRDQLKRAGVRKRRQ